jgi:hypothetical protein
MGRGLVSAGALLLRSSDYNWSHGMLTVDCKGVEKQRTLFILSLKIE